MQYHIETEPDTVPTWGRIPEYKSALEKAAGSDALARFTADADANMAQFRRDSRRLYENFMATTGLKSPERLSAAGQ